MSFKSNSTIALYRGDSTAIQQFDINKTGKHCLLGRGIYLTTNRNIADTYRTKGDGNGKLPITNILVRGSTANVGRLVDKLKPYVLAAFVSEQGNIDPSRRFGELTAEELDMNTVPAYRQPKPKNLSTRQTMLQDQAWADIRVELEITKAKHVRHYNETVWKSEVQISWSRMRCSSRVTEFVFPHRHLLDHTIDASVMTRDSEILNLVKQSQKKRTLRNRTKGSSMPEIDFDKPAILMDIRHRVDFEKLRTNLEPYGYIGFRHDGGVLTGGTRHQVFVLWDDGFVNQHKVRSF